MRDLTARVLDNLLEVKDEFDLRHLAEPCILVSHDLSPSTTAQLDKKFVLGFATDIGGKTSHTAIMARSLGIPAVGRPANRQPGIGQRRLCAAGRLQRHGHRQSDRPDAV